MVISSLSLTVLFEGNDELPGFHIMSQEELLRELLHLGGRVQVFALHVRDEGDLEAERHNASDYSKSPSRPLALLCTTPLSRKMFLPPVGLEGVIWVWFLKDQHQELVHLQEEGVSAVLRKEGCQEPVFFLS